MRPLPEDHSEQISDLLARVRSGDEAAFEALMPIVNGELRQIAKRRMADQPRGHTLQTTALVNEAAIRLLRNDRGWQDEAHFFKVAACAMRSILVDHARRRSAKKRSTNGVEVDLGGLVAACESSSGSLIDLDHALDRLRERDPVAVELIELRFFSGHSVEECARILGVSARHTQRLWQRARAWLRVEVDFD